MALGVTGPILRATGLPWDLRKSQPYLGLRDLRVRRPDAVDTCDAYGRYLIRMDEIEQSLRIIEQCVDRLADRATMPNDPWMIQDAKIGWPARLSLGPDGLGPSPEHIAHIMGQSMEALIHHFKLVTEGFRVPAGQAYVPIESPKGELGCHVVSDGGTRPYRAHLRDPSFHHLQAVSVLCEGGNSGGRDPGDRVDRPGDWRRGPVMPFSEETLTRLKADAAEITGRYPRARSALLPLLYLVQAEEGYVSDDGMAFCAEVLGITQTEVRGVSTFYTMYKHEPAAEYQVGVCINTTCAIMGGDQIYAELAEHLGGPIAHGDAPPRRHQVAGRQGRPRAPRVQRGLRLRPGGHGQLGVLRQPDASIRPSSWSTTCGRATTCGRPADLTGCAPGSRPTGSSPASATARPPKARRRARPAWSASKLAKERGWTAPPAEPRTGGGASSSAPPGTRRRSHHDRHPHPGPHRELGPAGLLHARRLQPDRRVPGAAQGAGDGAGRRDRHGEELRAARPRRRRASRPA